MKSMWTAWIGVMLALALAPSAARGAQVDEADALALIKATKCLTCHSVDKKKDGPPYIEVAQTYRGDPEAERKIVDWLSSEHEIEIDGEADTHPKAKTTDPARIGNLARWVLSH
jgi:cytochrome c